MWMGKRIVFYLGNRAYTYVLLKGKTKMKNESILYSYYNDEMQKSTTEDDAVYDKGAISEGKLKQAITSCANYLFSKRENKEKLVLEILCLEENENYQSRSNKIYKADKCVRKMVSYYFLVVAIILSVVQKILTSYTEMKYIYVLIIITLISAFFNWLKNYFENIPDMKLSKADAFYDSILKNTFKKVIKKMLVEQNSIKTMEKQEFESWFTSQVYSLLDICLL